MPETAARTLADQLRHWPDERLGALLEARPDLATPAPQDSAQLAARLATRPSVARALDRLTALDLAVAEAALHVGATGARSMHDVLRAGTAAVDTSVRRLLDLALLWGTPDDLRPVSVLAELLGSPRGPEVDAVPGLLDGISGPARALLRHLEERDADGRSDTLTEPIRELLDRRLVVQRDDNRHLVVPWTVRVAMREGRSTREPVDVPPQLATSAREPELVARAASGAAFELVRRVELLLDHWGTHAPAVLRTGGLGVRELKAAGGLLGLGPGETGLVVETAAAAGLVGPGATDDVDPAWLPTDAYDAWLGQPVAERWLALAEAWLANPRMTALVGGRDDADRPVNALSPDLERRWLADARHEALSELAAADGVLASSTGPASLLARLRWLRPRRPAGREQAVSGALAEAGLVGFCGLGGVAPYAALLLGGEREAASADLAALLPDPVDHVLLQADLTAVAPGPLESELARQLATIADVESRGGATVYRFGTGSVRRAFDAGWSAVEIKAFLDSSSRTPVPQALDFLVDDVARRFGTLRVGAVEAFLRSDDEAALSELLADPASASLRLRRIAPTVLVSDVPLHVLLPRLRELGHAPVAEAADGTVRVARPDVFRSRAKPARRAPAAVDARRAARTSAVVSAVRAGDRVAATRPADAAATSPGDVLTVLRQSVEGEREVLLDYVDNHGRRTDRVVRPVRVEGGQLVAYDDREQELRSFAVHRIGSVRTVPPHR